MNYEQFEIARSSLEVYPVLTAWEERNNGKKQWQIKVPDGVVTMSYVTGKRQNMGSCSLTGTYFGDGSPITKGESYQYASSQELFHKGEDMNKYAATWQMFFARILHNMHDGIRHHMTLASLYEVLDSKKLLDYPSWTTHITNELGEFRGGQPESELEFYVFDDEYFQITYPKLYANLTTLRFNAPYDNPYGGKGAGQVVNEPKFVLDKAKGFLPTDKPVVWEAISLTKEARYSMDKACRIHKFLQADDKK